MTRRYLLQTAVATAAPEDLLRVSADGRRLEKDGKPFFWLADTAWELFRRLDRPATQTYLARRAAQGFNVILASAFSEFSQRNEPNAYGQRPFLQEGDPLSANPDYLAHIDWVLAQAGQLGLTVGLLPAWGDKVFERPGNRNAILNRSNAAEYGRRLAARLGGHKNLLWVLGGDRNASGYEAVWTQMAKGIRGAEKFRHLMSFHPNGRHSASQWFQEAAWLDFVLLQSGHNLRDNPVHEMVRADYSRKPVKPIIDGEPAYEGHWVDWKQEKGVFTATDVRRHAYWAVFAGAAGHTYGGQGIWGFFAPGEGPPTEQAKVSWQEALEYEGALQLVYLRRLVEGLALAPAQDWLASGQGFGAEYVALARSPRTLLVYTAQERPYVLRLGRMPGETLRLSWFNPRDGQRQRGGTLPNNGMREVRPPSGEDWVLVAEPE